MSVSNVTSVGQAIRIANLLALSFRDWLLCNQRLPLVRRVSCHASAG